MTNNNIKKLAVAGLACVALAGTTFAAPHGGHATAPAPTHHYAPEHHPAPPPPHHHGEHRDGVCGGWIMAGAAAVGGLVGGIIGACR